MPACAEGGVVVEPLQIPTANDYHPDGYCIGETKLNPDDWDRSERPAGAGVFRLHHVRSECYESALFISSGSCAEIREKEDLVAPLTFYEVTQCTAIPGCPRLKQTLGEPGSWYYLVPQASDALDVVICAPVYFLAFSSGGDACLKLRPKRSAVP